jgi:signal transduction histidine kinase
MDKQPVSQNGHISSYIRAIEQLRQGNYDITLPPAPADEVGRLGEALRRLACTLEERHRQLEKLDHITANINAGLLLEDILDSVYEDFRGLIPYNRIGLSLIEEDGTVRACWARTDRPVIELGKDYTAPLEGSSLKRIIETGTPRILNDLEAYLEEHPDSESTRLIVAEGIRSSLTCPLITDGEPVGFIFFSSVEPHIYTEAHVESFRRIAGQLSVIVEKGRLASELAAQKAAIEQQNEELQQLNDFKDMVLAMAAHDLRNPGALIEMAVDMMLNPEMALTDEERVGLLQEISDQTLHMLALIDELLDVSQIESGKLELNLEPVSVEGFLTEAVRRHTRLAAPKGTRVVLEEGEEGTVMADWNRLRQVIDNLVSNAVKYSPAGSTVHIWAERVPSGWRINVRDEGPGIEADERGALFQYFSRLSARPTGGEKSTGLGLAITRKVIEAHGGQIDVDSGPGRGSTFWFTLPKAKE